MHTPHTPKDWPYSSNIFPHDKVRDSVSGIEGKVTGQYNYPNGCVRYEVTFLDKDGKLEQLVFDDQQLEVLERAHPENTDEARAAAKARYEEAQAKAAEAKKEPEKPKSKGGPRSPKAVAR